jgi:pimeloyl-ACP methyl ester carboxylesterase
LDGFLERLLERFNVHVALAKYFLAVICTALPLVNAAAAVERPVVVIPGVEGSRLCDKSGEILWGDRRSYTYSRINALRIPFGANGEESGIHSCGLITNVSLIPLFYQSEVYSTLITALHDVGYEDKDIIIFDYDWRLSNFENAERLHGLLLSKLKNSTDKVDIVAHSMGGIIARIYIQSFGGESRVQNFIMMGTPHLGSARVFAELKNGFDNWPDGLSGGLVEIQRTILSFPSTYQLLPMYDQCCGFSETVDPVGATYADILSPSTWGRFSWLPDEFKAGNGKDFLAKALGDAKRLKSLFARPLLQDTHSNSKLHFVANGFLDTWSRVFFHPKTGIIIGRTTMPGDGTVLLESATNGEPSQFQLSPLDHEHLFSSKEAALVLDTSLSGRSYHRGSGGFEQKIKSANDQDITVTSARFEVDHHFCPTGTPLVVTLILKGDESLRSATLPTLRVNLLKDGSMINSAPLTEDPRSGEERSFRYQLTAPTELGAYSLRLSAPDLPPVEAIFAVIGP